MSATPQDWELLVRWCLANFDERVDTIPAVVIPWGDDEQGLMVDHDVDAEGRPAWRIGIYADLGDVDVRMIHVDGVEDVIGVIEHLTEDQPEETDWLAWACQRADDGWPS